MFRACRDLSKPLKGVPMTTNWIRIGLASMTVTLLSSAVVRAESKESEESEQTISMKEAPKAVRQTIKREAEGAKVATVDIEADKGKLVYEADAVIDGTNYEILVDTNGRLLSKAIDNEDEEAKPAAKEKKDSDDDDKEAVKSHKDSDDDDKEGVSSERGEKAEHAQAEAEDDDDKPSAKAHKDSEDDDKEAVQSEHGEKSDHVKAEAEDDDKPSAKAKESDDDDKEVVQSQHGEKSEQAKADSDDDDHNKSDDNN
jgi:hypothetical protein